MKYKGVKMTIINSSSGQYKKEREGGRIQLGNEKYTDYQRTAESTTLVRDNIIEDVALKGKIQSTQLSKVFFSQTNIDALQLGLRNSVYNNSNGTYGIGKQSVDELLIVMRSIFAENARNLPFKILEQVRDLNDLVLKYCVPRILSELEQHSTYIKDIQQGPTFFDRPGSTSVTGTKSLEFIKF